MSTEPNEHHIVLTDRADLQRDPEPRDLLSVIARIAIDPRTDVEKVERLCALQRQNELDQREIAFKQAMARLQGQLPMMDKYGRAKNSKFAKLEDIHQVIQPLLFKEGFSLSFDEESHTEKEKTFVMTCDHDAGHSKTKRLTVPIDIAARNSEGKGIRPAIQDAGSTVSYARRYLLKMMFNIVEKDEDTDGESLRPITADQALEINTMLVDTKSDKAKFLKLIAGVPSIEEIPARDFRRVMNALEEKRRQQK